MVRQLKRIRETFRGSSFPTDAARRRATALHGRVGSYLACDRDCDRLWCGGRIGNEKF